MLARRAVGTGSRHLWSRSAAAACAARYGARRPPPTWRLGSRIDGVRPTLGWSLSTVRGSSEDEKAQASSALPSSSPTDAPSPASKANDDASLNKERPMRPTRDTFRQFLQLAKPEAPAFGVALGAVAVGTATTTVFPLAIGKCMDAMTAKGVTARQFLENTFGPVMPVWLLDAVPPDAEPLAVLSGGLVGVFALGALSTFVRNSLVHIAGDRIAARLRKRVFAAIMHQHMSFFDSTRTGELLNRLSNDVTQVSKTLSEDTSYFLRNFAQGAGALAMMLYTSPQLCGIMLAVIPPTAAWGVYFGRKVRALSRESVDKLAAAGTVAEERLGNIRIVRALGNDQLEVARYAHQVNNAYLIAKQQGFLQGIYYGVAMGSGNLGMVAVLYYGGHLVGQGLITVGDLSTMLLYSLYAGFSISALLSYYGDLMKAAGSAQRIFELMDSFSGKGLVSRAPAYVKSQVAASDAHSDTPAHTHTDVCGPLVFEEVSFKYPTRPDFTIFDQLNLEVKKNETLALVGPSGSGKSTIAALLTRMYEPDSGRILVGLQHVPLQDIPKEHLRKSIAYVPQDAVLFSGSVKENLFLGFNDLDNRPLNINDGLRILPIKEHPKQFSYASGAWDMEERMHRVREACRIANCLNFIEQWDDGFDTVIGERGAQLSGGQRARIALARAILRDSDVLILDEISAALDSVSEAELHSALRNVLAQRTAILIAHRWSSIQIADRIAVLGDGRVAEVGTHHDLLSSNDSAFRALVQHQLDGTAALGHLRSR